MEEFGLRGLRFESRLDLRTFSENMPAKNRRVNN